MAKITKELVDNLNQVLEDKRVGFEYKFDDKDTIVPCMRIQVIDTCGFVDNSVINCTQAYYDWLVEWIKTNYDIDVCFNNTRSTIWSKDFGS